MTALSIVSRFIFAAKALSITARRDGLFSMTPPPILAATTISLINLVKILPRLASCAPLRCWILCHLLCPAIAASLRVFSIE